MPDILVMPPSSLLMTLYPEDDGTSQTSSDLPTNTDGKHIPVIKQLVPGNTNLTNRHETAVKRLKCDSSPLFSSDPQSVVTAHVAPYLEMEGEEEKYDDAMLQVIPLNNDENKEHNMQMIDIPLINQGIWKEEEKEENEESHGVSSKGSLLVQFQPSSSSMHCKSIDGNTISRGKRPRSRGVTFVDVSDQDCADSDEHRHVKRSLVWVRDTIHVSDYTPEERRASWYTFEDLKSFKKQRKETARQIENGLLSLPSLCIPLSQTSERNYNGDIYVDTTSSSEPIAYCSRGVENCTEANSRIRYRHICTGWKAVFNVQEVHKYKQQKMTRMSSFEKHQFDALASFLGSSGKKNPSRKHRTTNASSNSSSNNSKDPYDSMCCPYQLAAAYQPSSEASLSIARNRALIDESYVAAQLAQEQKFVLGKRTAAASINNPSVVEDANAKTVYERNENEDANKPNIEKCVEHNKENSTGRFDEREELARRRTIDI